MNSIKDMLNYIKHGKHHLRSSVAIMLFIKSCRTVQTLIFVLCIGGIKLEKILEMRKQLKCKLTKRLDFHEMVAGMLYDNPSILIRFLTIVYISRVKLREARLKYFKLHRQIHRNLRDINTQSREILGYEPGSGLEYVSFKKVSPHTLMPIRQQAVYEMRQKTRQHLKNEYRYLLNAINLTSILCANNCEKTPMPESMYHGLIDESAMLSLGATHAERLPVPKKRAVILVQKYGPVLMTLEALRALVYAVGFMSKSTVRI